jgi:hypothetical protein
MTTWSRWKHLNVTCEGIPNAELAIVPGTSQFPLQEKPTLCNRSSSTS